MSSSGRRLIDTIEQTPVRRSHKGLSGRFGRWIAFEPIDPSFLWIVLVIGALGFLLWLCDEPVALGLRSLG